MQPLNKSVFLRNKQSDIARNLKLDKMYFLRFTNSAEEDLERSTSINASDLNASIVSTNYAASLFGCDENDIINIDGCLCQQLDGLCGYELSAESIEDAIEEVKSSNWQFEFVGQPVIFKGKYATDSIYVADGVLFTPFTIEAKL